MGENLIPAQDREAQRKKHQDSPDWGMTGHRWVQPFVDVFRRYASPLILDWGSGKGSFKAELAKVFPWADVVEYDPCVEGKEELNDSISYDWVVCIDTMEHIREDHVDANLLKMSEVATLGFFAIHCDPAIHFLPDGRNAHLTIRTPEWWISKLCEFGFLMTSTLVSRNPKLLLAVVEFSVYPK